MATLRQVRTAIGDRLRTIPGLRVQESYEGTISPPTAVVMAEHRRFLSYSTTQGGQTHDANFLIHLFVSKNTDRVAQDVLDEYCEPEGAKSVYAAVSGVLDVNGEMLFAEVMECRNYGTQVVGKSPDPIEQYLGAEFVVNVGL